jgi:hypothetical protein
MSTTAEDVSTNLSSHEPRVDQTDAIAELLVGEDEPKIEEAEGEETPTQASTQEEGEESNEDGEAESGEEEEATLEAVADEDPTWAGMLGVSEDDLSFDEDGNPAGFNTKVNGESEVVSTKDLLAGFQNNKAFTVKSQALAEQTKAFEVQKEQVEQAYAFKLETVDALTQHFEQQLISEYDDVDWNKLNTDDPARYAAMKIDFQSKAGELQRIKDAISTDKETHNNESLVAQNEKATVYMKQQYDTMLINNPEWSDEPTRNKARDSFKSFVTTQYGFNDTEFDSVFDARLIEMIKDAQKYHEGAQVAAKKKLKPVPKFQKSAGSGTKPKVSKLDKLTAASRKARGSAKRDLQQSAVAELLLGGS